MFSKSWMQLIFKVETAVVVEVAEGDHVDDDSSGGSVAELSVEQEVPEPFEKEFPHDLVSCTYLSEEVEDS